MSVPKAVVFDLGKVLLDFDYGIAVRRFLARVHLSPLEMLGLINHSTLFPRYEAGLLSTEAFFEEVRKVSGFQGELTEFTGMFGDIFTEIPPMVALHAELRQRGLPTYVFSNTNDLAIRHVRQRFPFFSQFDGYVLSYEHRCMRPDARLYEVVERVSGLRGQDLFYLDDRTENVAAGAARGWQAVLHESAEKSRAAAQRAGLLDGCAG
jgi:HAD superfamily hydrolase (TIGR01509 family)